MGLYPLQGMKGRPAAGLDISLTLRELPPYSGEENKGEKRHRDRSQIKILHFGCEDPGPERTLYDVARGISVAGGNSGIGPSYAGYRDPCSALSMSQ